MTESIIYLPLKYHCKRKCAAGKYIKVTVYVFLQGKKLAEELTSTIHYVLDKPKPKQRLSISGRPLPTSKNALTVTQDAKVSTLLLVTPCMHISRITAFLFAHCVHTPAFAVGQIAGCRASILPASQLRAAGRPLGGQSRHSVAGSGHEGAAASRFRALSRASMGMFRSLCITA